LKENIAGLLRGSSKIRRVNAGTVNEAGVLPCYVSAKDQSSSFLITAPLNAIFRRSLHL
jgi:hypothetical protein